MATKRKKTIVELIHNRHLSLYKDLNEIQIFISEITPLLESATIEYKEVFIDPDDGASYIIQKERGSERAARRNYIKLSSLFKRFVNRDLYENFLVSSVSRFEFYLSDVIREFLRASSTKLSLGLKGGESKKQFPVQLVANSNNLNELTEKIIDCRLQAIFYAKPKDYCAYFKAVSELDIFPEQFAAFFEIKATRDLIVHNSLVVNDKYLEKADKLRRGELGDKLKVTKDYFENSISAMKNLSNIIDKKTHEKYYKP